MRRPAGMAFLAIAGLLTVAGCSEKLLLPGAAGGSGLDGGTSTGSGGSSGAGGTQGGTGGFIGRNCPIPLNFQRQKGALLISLARGSSMNMPFGNANSSRMDVVQQQLSAGVMMFRNAINFGYQDFPGTQNNCNFGQGCCARSNNDAVNTGPSTFSVINPMLQTCSDRTANNCVSNFDTRPVADALMKADQLLGSDNRDHTLLMILDGPPSCSAEVADESCNNARAAMAALASTEVKALVVAIVGAATEGAPACLAMMAAEGNASVLAVHDPAQLSTTLSAILAQAALPACQLRLLDTPNDSNRVTVQMGNDQKPIPRDATDGWSFVPGASDRIEIHGASCLAVQGSGSPNLQVAEDNPCPPQQL